MGRPNGSREALELDWRAVCRRAAAGVREALGGYPLTADRAATSGRGEGGDMSLVIDRAAEDAVFAALEATGAPMTVVSEERGEVALAGGGPAYVVVDPVDGSLNAKRRLPLHCVSIAVADGRTMGDVLFAYVAMLDRDAEWWARRGEGAFRGGERLRIPPPAGERELEVLAVESANPRLVADAADALAATGAHRLRALGAIALSLCFVAGAEVDAMASLRPCRSVDAAAGQLIVREAGGVVAFPDAAPDPLAAPLDLGMRSRVLAAPRQALLDGLLATLTDSG